MNAADKRKRLEERILPLLRCVRCASTDIDLVSDRLSCTGCTQVYPIHNSIPLMTLNPDRALDYRQEVVVENAYSEQWLNFIQRAEGRPVLDLGSGNNPGVHEHVVKTDVFAMPNIDIVAQAEELPFRDGVFHTVISGAVFEHLRDPFRAIDSLYRVIQDGGEVYIETAFLQPVHAFPNHYFNMTLRGLERLCSSFERLDSGVQPHQAASFMLRWVLQSWAAKLPEPEQQQFMQTTIAEVIQEYTTDVFSKRWMEPFTRKDHEELAAGVYYHGYKAPRGGAPAEDRGGGADE